MGCSVSLSTLRHVIFGVLLASFNFGSSLVNIYYLFKENHVLFGILDLFLLWFPGLTVFVVLAYLQGRDESLVKVPRLQFWLVTSSILVFCPLVPIALTIAFLVTGSEKIHHKATMAKLFAGFLDHGPHFVLRLVIVVLIGLSQGGVYNRDDHIFILSMVTSFLAFILTTLWFNERRSSILKWVFLSGPMYSAIFACRAFTLAVFLKETLHNDKTDAPWAIFILSIMLASNVTLFRLCGQDWLRSGVFAITSILVPSGFNNDPLYYQLPNQEVTLDQTKVYSVTTCEQEIEFKDENEPQENAENIEAPSRMRSTRFFILHVLFNTILMCCVSSFLFTTSEDLDSNSDDALVIPQLLGVVPGMAFSIGYCFTLRDTSTQSGDAESCCRACCGRLQKSAKMILSTVFTVFGYLSLVPALFWTFIYKWFTSFDEDVRLVMTKYASKE